MASPGSIQGRTLGHYRIVEQIGASGMGVVYRADQAFRYLERAYQEYDSGIFQIQHPAFDSLRDDPRWMSLLKRLNLQDTPMAKLPAAPAPAAH